MKKTVFILILLLSTTPVFAQHGANGYSKFSFITPAHFSFGTDNNFLVDRVPPDQKLLILSMPASVLPGAPDLRPEKLDDTFFLLRAPTLAFIDDTSKREFAVTYMPEFEIFAKNSDQNALNQLATVDFSQYFSRRFQVYAGDAYRSSNDPSRTLQNVFLMLPRSRYQENDFRVGASYSHSERTTFIARFDNTISTFAKNDPLQRRILDTISNGFSFSVSQMIRRNHRLRVTYSLFATSPWNRRKTADERVDTEFVAFKEPSHSLAGEYRFTINPRTVFSFGAGGIQTQAGPNYTLGAYADRRLGEIWLGGGYTRSLSFFATPRLSVPNGLASNSFYEIVSFYMRGQPTRNTGVNIAVAASHGIDGSILEQNKTVLGRARFDYRLSDRTVTFLSAELYGQNRNAYVGTPLNRSRFSMGIEYSIATEAERRLSRLNRDADNVALTEHGRRRQRPQ